MEWRLLELSGTPGDGGGEEQARGEEGGEVGRPVEVPL